MNRSFYISGIFSTGLLIAISLIASIIFLNIGPTYYVLESFIPWFFLFVGIYFLSTGILLKYLHHKTFQIAFLAGIFLIISAIFHFVVSYETITMGSNKYFSLSYYTIHLAGILFALSFIFSKASQRPLLKKAGILLLIFDCAGILLYSLPLFLTDIQIEANIANVYAWVSIIGNCFPIIMIVNFANEMSLLPKSVEFTSKEKSTIGAIALFGIALFATTGVFSKKIIKESSHIITWEKGKVLRSKKLAIPFEGRTYSNNQGQSMPYRLLKPQDYDPEKKYPLVVCLHHGGANGTDNLTQIEGAELAVMLSQEINQKKYPAFVLVPQLPPGTSFGGLPAASNLSELDDLVFEIMNTLEDEFQIDEKRRYVTGISLGGYGTWHFITSRPQMFAAAIPVCGGGNPTLAGNATDVAVWVFHGKKDRQVPVKLARDMIEAFDEAGGSSRYNEFPLEGHNIWESVKATPGLLDWLFEQKQE